MKAAAAHPATLYKTGSTPRIRSWRAKDASISTNTRLAARSQGEVMACSTCTYLEGALRNRNSKYVQSCAGTYSQFSSRFVAYDAVPLPRVVSRPASYIEHIHSGLQVIGIVRIAKVAAIRGFDFCSVFQGKSFIFIARMF